MVRLFACFAIVCIATNLYFASPFTFEHVSIPAVLAPETPVSTPMPMHPTPVTQPMWLQLDREIIDLWDEYRVVFKYSVAPNINPNNSFELRLHRVEIFDRKGKVKQLVLETDDNKHELVKWFNRLDQFLLKNRRSS